MGWNRGRKSGPTNDAPLGDDRAPSELKLTSIACRPVFQSDIPKNQEENADKKTRMRYEEARYQGAHPMSYVNRFSASSAKPSAPIGTVSDVNVKCQKERVYVEALTKDKRDIWGVRRLPHA